MGLSASLGLQFKARLTGSNLTVGKADFSPAFARTLDFLDGVAAYQADLLYAARRSIASAANDDIDLAGVLTNAFGTTITNAELVALLISSDPANTTSLTLGGGSNPWLGILQGTTPTIRNLGPGGIFMMVSPDAGGLGAVVAGTGDILRIANASGALANVDVFILGRTA